MTDTYPLAARHADRVRALIRHCPDGKTLKLREGNRIAECTRGRDGGLLTLKLGLRSDVTGTALLHAIFRVTDAAGDGAVTLHHLEGRRETPDLTKRQEQYLAALLGWAEHVLPSAPPVAPAPRVPAWQRDYVALYGHLAGCSPATARRRLCDGFFVDQEDATDDGRMNAFIDLLRDEDRVVAVDLHEETIEALIRFLAEQRLGRTCPGSVRLALAEADLDLLIVEDGDGLVIGIVPIGQIDAAAALVTRLAPLLTVRGFA